MKIEVNRLRKTFGRMHAVNNISFTFESGQIYGFIGPNGAGKTTTIRIMSTLSLPTTGDIYFDGVSVVQEPEAIRRAIGYMPDSLPAHNDITVWEYLDFFARSYGIHDPKRTKVLKGVEEFTGLGHMRRKFLKDLSKGMKQRVSLARALLHDPSVLIMDEPAAGLDPRARIELRELLKVLAAQNKAILISSHILTELQDICNGAAIIEKGKILSAGTMKEVMEPHQENHTVVYIRSCQNPNELRMALNEVPHVEDVADANNDEFKITVAGGDQECSEILNFLISSKCPVAEFRQAQVNLEDVFMNVTKGKLQ